MGGGGVSAKEYSCAHGAQINFGDLTPYLTYDVGRYSVLRHHYLQQASGQMFKDGVKGFSSTSNIYFMI
jgi:hypothetical protein